MGGSHATGGEASVVVVYLLPLLLFFPERNKPGSRGGARQLAQTASAISGQMETTSGVVEFSRVRSEVKEGVGGAEKPRRAAPGRWQRRAVVVVGNGQGHSGEGQGGGASREGERESVECSGGGEGA